MPPLPSSEVIWYEPSCVPIVTDKYNSLLSCVELRGLYKSVNTRSMEWARHAFAACCQPTPPGSLHNSIQQGSLVPARSSLVSHKAVSLDLRTDRWTVRWPESIAHFSVQYPGLDVVLQLRVDDRANFGTDLFIEYR